MAGSSCMQPFRMPTQGACIALRADIGGEALLFSAQGTPTHAFSNSSVYDTEFVRDYAIIYPCATGGEIFHAFLEGVAHGLFGVNRQTDPALDDNRRHGTFSPAIEQLSLGCVR